MNNWIEGYGVDDLSKSVERVRYISLTRSFSSFLPPQKNPTAPFWDAWISLSRFVVFFEDLKSWINTTRTARGISIDRIVRGFELLPTMTRLGWFELEKKKGKKRKMKRKTYVVPARNNSTELGFGQGRQGRQKLNTPVDTQGWSRSGTPRSREHCRWQLGPVEELWWAARLYHSCQSHGEWDGKYVNAWIPWNTMTKTSGSFFA